MGIKLLVNEFGIICYRSFLPSTEITLISLHKRLDF